MAGVEEKEGYQEKGDHREKGGYRGKRIQEEKHNAKKIRRKSQRDKEKIVLCENRGKLFKQLLIYYIIISVR